MSRNRTTNQKHIRTLIARILDIEEVEGVDIENRGSGHLMLLVRSRLGHTLRLTASATTSDGSRHDKNVVARIKRHLRAAREGGGMEP